MKSFIKIGLMGLIICFSLTTQSQAASLSMYERNNMYFSRLKADVFSGCVDDNADYWSKKALKIAFSSARHVAAASAGINEKVKFTPSVRNSKTRQIIELNRCFVKNANRFALSGDDSPRYNSFKIKSLALEIAMHVARIMSLCDKNMLKAAYPVFIKLFDDVERLSFEEGPGVVDSWSHKCGMLAVEVSNLTSKLNKALCCQ